MKTKLDCSAGWHSLDLEELTQWSSKQIAEASLGESTTVTVVGRMVEKRVLVKLSWTTVP